MNKTTSKHFWERLSNQKLIRYLLLFALGWVLIQILAYFETVIIIFILASILAFLLNYPVEWISRFFPRTVAVILVFLFSLLILAALIVTLGFSIISQTQALLEESSQIVNYVISLLNQIQEFLNERNLTVNFAAIEEQFRQQAAAVIQIGFSKIQGLLSNFIDLILIAVVVFFMLLDGKDIWSLMLKAFPKNIRPDLTEAIRRNFLGFFWGRLLLSIFLGISSFIVFIILQIPQALALAAIAGVFDLIPGIGATIGISLVSLIVLPQGIWLSIKVLIVCILLQQVEENLLMPRIMQGSININPVFMFFALLVGARVAGLIGIFLSIPIAGVLISVFNIQDLQAK